MALSVDPEIFAGLAPVLAAAGGVARPPVGDVATRRANAEAVFALLNASLPAEPGVDVSSYQVPVAGGSIEVRGYRPAADPPGSAALYLHGGGMILGSLDQYDPGIKAQVAASGVPLFAPEYRLAPEFPSPTPVEDCHAALLWLAEHAEEFGIDPLRIAVMGDSAGGGLAAGVALLNRDRCGPQLARQILIYPMLDDRNTVPDPTIAGFATWTYDDNVTGWGALLGAAVGSRDAGAVPIYSAPARATDLAGLPPAYLDVGDLDIFRDEDLDYAHRLSSAGVPVEFHLHPGCPHSFEGFARDAAVSRRATADRIRVLRSI